MGGLAHYIERAGVPTTGISLIREHTEALRPPRALWVPFALGRPLGVAGDRAFQRRVLSAALALLETATEPMIVDYQEEAPPGADIEHWVCPVTLPSADADTLGGRLRSEIARLRPWSEETRAQRGRTLFGASGAEIGDVESVAALLAAIAEGAALDTIPSSLQSIQWSHPMPFLLRHAADDLRTFYQEAVAARPGADAPSHATLTHWIFNQTVLGEALTKVADAITATGERRLLTLRGYLIPEGYVEGDESFGMRQPGDPEGFLRAVRGNAYLRGEDID